METFDEDGFLVRYDHDATVAAYREIAQGGANVCSCSGCDNFARLRSRVYPPEFLRILSVLGIDPSKENEAWQCGTDKTGLYVYGGWFHFVGEVAKAGPTVNLGGFEFGFAQGGALPGHDTFAPGPVAAIDFVTRLPWVSDLPEADPPPKGAGRRIADYVRRRLGSSRGQCRP